MATNPNAGILYPDNMLYADSSFVAGPLIPGWSDRYPYTNLFVDQPNRFWAPGYRFVSKEP